MTVINRIYNHLLKFGTITMSEAVDLGAAPKNLSHIIFRLRHNRKIKIMTLDRRKTNWLKGKEQSYKLVQN